MFRVGDLVQHTESGETGIVLKVRRREIASPHPNYRGKHPPIEGKVMNLVEVMWSNGTLDLHEAELLIKIKRNLVQDKRS